MIVAMCMSCHHGNNRKRIAIIAGAGSAAAGIGYVSLAATPVTAAALPAVIAFAACPAMCVAMGGAMWLSRRFKKRDSVILEQKKNINEQIETEEDSKVENQLSLDDKGKEIVQVQYEKRKRKARENDVDLVIFSN